VRFIFSPENLGERARDRLVRHENDTLARRDAHETRDSAAVQCHGTLVQNNFARAVDGALEGWGRKKKKKKKKKLREFCEFFLKKLFFF
jgi:hypothetical protein